jgi:hypothetical protein
MTDLAGGVLLNVFMTFAFVMRKEKAARVGRLS